MNPVILAEWEFHGEHFQIWDQKGRMWVMHEKTPVNDAIGPEWEALYIL